jgi:hypothetical protein
MTTVAYKNGVLAADSLQVDGGVAQYAEKILDGGQWWIAGAGNAAQIQMIAATVKAGDRLATENFNFGEEWPNVLAMHKKTGEVWSYLKWCWMKVDQPSYAIGSGRDFALAAMHLDEDAADAVGVACCFDVNSDFPVKSVQVEKHD